MITLTMYPYVYIGNILFHWFVFNSHLYISNLLATLDSLLDFSCPPGNVLWSLSLLLKTVPFLQVGDMHRPACLMTSWCWPLILFFSLKISNFSSFYWRSYLWDNVGMLYADWGNVLYSNITAVNRRSKNAWEISTWIEKHTEPAKLNK